MSEQSVSPAPEKSEAEKTFDCFETQTRFLLGDILTIVDASFSDLVQRKAVKDLVKHQFHSRIKWMYEVLTGGRMVTAAGETPKTPA